MLACLSSAIKGICFSGEEYGVEVAVCLIGWGEYPHRISQVLLFVPWYLLVILPHSSYFPSMQGNKLSTIHAYTASSDKSIVIHRANGIYSRGIEMHVFGLASLCNFDLDTFPPSALVYVSSTFAQGNGD